MQKFTSVDHHDIKARGISLQDIEKQILYFREGIPFLPVTKPAISGSGILHPNEDTLDDFIKLYDSGLNGEKVLKFVPASGAATRMFKDLFTYLESSKESQPDKAVSFFTTGLKDFAFYGHLESVLVKKGLDPESLLNKKDYAEIINALLGIDGLNYSNMPKGLLTFHRYGDNTRTAFEEHLVEGALYCRGGDGIVRIHLTVSPEHLESFKALYNNVRVNLEKEHNVKYEVGFSTQNPSTDTIAVDTDNNPFRDSNGKLVFRPGGHGALLENLDGLGADIIFIKNIDNVVPDHLKSETVRFKKSLAGMLLSYRGRIFHYLNMLEDKLHIESGLLEEIRIFLEDELGVISPPDIDHLATPEIKKYLVSKLNRPVRVCGMVRNAGEPGGGPFWVKNSDGSVSLQIAESSQINLANPLMKKLFDASTHFNPVDLVCSVKDFRGEKFDLHQFSDPGTGFISAKSMEGRELKALELPGLWNGAMANWNTIFVEVPLSTFNPVKTINDLLRQQHKET